MIAIARTLSNAFRHGRTNYQVCQRSVTSVVAFNVSNNRSRAVCRKNHSYDIIGMYHNIDDIRLRSNDRCHIRRFASHAAQQQQKEEDEDENSVDEIDKEEEDLIAEVHEANERCVLILCSRNMQSLHIDYSPFTNFTNTCAIDTLETYK